MNSAGAVTPELLETARVVVRRRTGLVFGPARTGAFESGFVRAASRHPGVAPEHYLRSLERDSTALDDLVAEITVGETYFFREPEQCSVIRHKILPAVGADKSRLQPLRLWSAGCATGEEVYTLAMLLHESGAQPARILGTDLSRSSLARARRGQYSTWSMRGVPGPTIEAWFDREGKRYTIRPALREGVEFQYLNLAEDTYPSLGTGLSAMDLIVCRNVLIYFDTEIIARVARRLLDCLSPDGWLVLGSSDPMINELVECEVVVTTAGLVYRPSGTTGPAVGFTPLTPDVDYLTPTEPASLEEPVASEPGQPAELESGASDVARAGEDDPVVCFQSHRYERAAQLAAGQLDQTPDSLPHWIIWVRALANLGRLGEADRACIAGLDHHKTSPELFYLHAVLLTEASHHEAAAGAARRALYLDRGFVMAHLVLARSLTRLGDVIGARRSLENATRLLTALKADELVPASDGESAGRLAEMARVQITLLKESAA